MEIGKTYFILQSAPTGIRGKRVVVTKITSKTVWVRFDMGEIYFYRSEFKKWAQEIEPWTGSKLIHNFL